MSAIPQDGSQTGQADPTTQIDPDRLGEQAVGEGARMHNARLGGKEGVGTLQVTRGGNGNVLEIRGTWRSRDDAASDDGELATLCDAAASGGTVRYQGPLADPDGGRDRIDVDVAFTSTSRYTFDDAPGGRATEGPNRRIFNFRPVDGEAALRR